MFLNGDDKGMYEGSNGKNGSDRLLVWKGDGVSSASAGVAARH